jgi:hypothetical protein
MMKSRAFCFWQRCGIAGFGAQAAFAMPAVLKSAGPSVTYWLAGVAHSLPRGAFAREHMLEGSDDLNQRVFARTFRKASAGNNSRHQSFPWLLMLYRACPAWGNAKEISANLPLI